MLLGVVLWVRRYYSLTGRLPDLVQRFLEDRKKKTGIFRGPEVLYDHFDTFFAAWLSIWITAVFIMHFYERGSKNVRMAQAYIKTLSSQEIGIEEPWQYGFLISEGPIREGSPSEGKRVTLRLSSGSKVRMLEVHLVWTSEGWKVQGHKVIDWK